MIRTTEVTDVRTARATSLYRSLECFLDSYGATLEEKDLRNLRIAQRIIRRYLPDGWVEARRKQSKLTTDVFSHARKLH